MIIFIFICKFCTPKFNIHTLCKDFSRDDNNNYSSMKSQYMSLKSFLKDNGNTQSCAKLWKYGFDLLQEKGIINGVLKYGSNCYFLLVPHEIEIDRVSDLDDVLYEMFETNWLGAKSGRGGTTSLVPTTPWWYITNVDNTYGLSEGGIAFGKIGEDDFVKWLKKEINADELYAIYEFDKNKIMEIVDKHPVRKEAKILLDQQQKKEIRKQLQADKKRHKSGK